MSAGGVAMLLAGALACGGGAARDVPVASATERSAVPDSTPTGVGSPAGAVANTPGASTAPRVVFIGTSLTAGLGLDPDSAYPAVVGRRAAADGVPITVVNAGVSGETSAGALRRVDWVLQQPAAVVVIETGANDGLRGQSTDSLQANLEAIVAKVRRDQPRARIALVQMEATRNFGASYTNRFHAVYPAVAQRDSVALFPFLLDGVAGDARLNQADGVHPTAEGARKVADNVWKALKPLVTTGAPAATTTASRVVSPR